MKDNWKKLQNDKVVNSDPVEKKINHLKKVINDPDGYNTNLASKDRVKELEQKVDEPIVEQKVDETIVEHELMQVFLLFKREKRFFNQIAAALPLAVRFERRTPTRA